MIPGSAGSAETGRQKAAARKKRGRKRSARRRQARVSRPVIRGRLRANEEAYERGKKRAKKKAAKKAVRAKNVSKGKLPMIRGRLRANEKAYERGKARARATRASGGRNEPVVWGPCLGCGGGGGAARGGGMGAGARGGGPQRAFIPDTAFPLTSGKNIGAYLRLFRPTGPGLQRKLRRAGWSWRPERARGNPNYIRLPDGTKVRSGSQGPGTVWTSPDGNYSVRIMTKRIVGGLQRRAIVSKKTRDRQGRDHWQPLDKDGQPGPRNTTHHDLDNVPTGRGPLEEGVPFRPGQGGHV
jgi:hypothetical protein